MSKKKRLCFREKYDVCFARKMKKKTKISVMKICMGVRKKWKRSTSRHLMPYEYSLA